MRAKIICGVALALLVACGDTERPLRDMRAAGGGPDEFAIMPVGPLEIPAQLTLPPPTPGGTNLTDLRPKADAIAALGGSAAAQRAGGVPAQDAALVAQASRYGTEPGIRDILAAEDDRILQRKRRSNVFNPLNRDRYFPAYARQVLDPFAELARLRALGVQVPNLPVAQPRAVPPAATETPAQEPGLLQRTLGSVFQPAPREVDGVPVDCVFTTIGSEDGRLRRVCTPITDTAQ
jgi:hypothetical protein